MTAIKRLESPIAFDAVIETIAPEVPRSAFANLADSHSRRTPNGSLELAVFDALLYIRVCVIDEAA